MQSFSQSRYKISRCGKWCAGKLYLCESIDKYRSVKICIQLEKEASGGKCTQCLQNSATFKCTQVRKKQNIVF